MRRSTSRHHKSGVTRPYSRPTGIIAVPSRAKQDSTHDRVRTDRIDDSGVVTLRVDSKLRRIGIGRTHARTHVKLLIKDLDVTVINATTGEVLRELTIDLSRDYQPTGNPKGPTPKTK
ncbi:hypothetical protein [Pseudoclavibacter helvolus]|uniref:hypothetical protein n=1 Tax=Pseudoclavibacter helvolus TaxID=255205 RepID=UPI003C733D59